MTRAQYTVNKARQAFNHAFYGNGSVEDKMQAAYECSIAYEMTNNVAIAMMFEQIGNYWYNKFRSQNEFSTTEGKRPEGW